MNRGRLLPLALAAMSTACTDLERYSTNQGDAYCGSITLGRSFRTGFSPRVQMRLHLDATELDGPGSAGSITTFEAADGTRPERRLLDDAALRPIRSLESDPLSHLEFGEGRTRNAMFAVSPRAVEIDGGAPAEIPESMLAILSLRADNTVEVRLLRPGAAQESDESVPAARRPLFGIFPLTRQVGTCGF